jgi:hypothetical protein
MSTWNCLTREVCYGALQSRDARFDRVHLCRGRFDRRVLPPDLSRSTVRGALPGDRRNLCCRALVGYICWRSAYIVLAALFGGLILDRIASLAINRGFEGYTSTILAVYPIDATGLLLALAAIAADRDTGQTVFRKQVFDIPQRT